MPWIAQRGRTIQEVQLGFESRAHLRLLPTVTAAMLGGNAEVALTAVGNHPRLRSRRQRFVLYRQRQEYPDPCLLAKPEIKRMEDLKSKKSAITASAATPLLHRSSPAASWN